MHCDGPYELNYTQLNHWGGGNHYTCGLKLKHSELAVRQNPEWKAQHESATSGMLLPAIKAGLCRFYTTSPTAWQKIFWLIPAVLRMYIQHTLKITCATCAYCTMWMWKLSKMLKISWGKLLHGFTKLLISAKVSMYVVESGGMSYP